jgi:hypothetical protein
MDITSTGVIPRALLATVVNTRRMVILAGGHEYEHLGEAGKRDLVLFADCGGVDALSYGGGEL